MSTMLAVGRSVSLSGSASRCTVTDILGVGGQGEVYEAVVDPAGADPFRCALKWYHPTAATRAQRKALLTLIERGAPSEQFLWPIELTHSDDTPGFGYIMPLRQPRFRGLAQIMRREVEPSFRALTTAGFELSHNFLLLHAQGLCYRDINFGNIFLDPDVGAVLICDNDNVGVDGVSDARVLGTPRFMAPEIVRGDALPSTRTDLFSLSVLLFYLFVVHHPFEGQLELMAGCLDLPAMRRLYGTDPLFVFHPTDTRNAPVPGHHDNALELWPIFPPFLHDLFVRAFTDGIADTGRCRVQESEWRGAMVRLRDAIVYCGHCGAENFTDERADQQPGCWSCHRPVRLPPRLRVARQVVMLNHDTRLFAHHVSRRTFDFSRPLAEVTRHPEKPDLWGLKNVSDDAWDAVLPDGRTRSVIPGRSVGLVGGTRIRFGHVEGEIDV